MIFEKFDRSDSNRPFSPSKGNQTKYRINDTWYKEDYLGYEGASEFLCSQILEHSNISDYIPYTIEVISCNEHQVLGCGSRHFLKENEALYTLNDIWNLSKDKPFYKYIENLSTSNRIQEVVSFIENELHIPNAGEVITLMLELDAFTLNEDRHANNIAFIEGVDGTKRFAPIFDNGASFLSDTTNYSASQSVRRIIPSVKAKPFNTSFDKQVKACEQLYGKQINLYDFDMTNAFDTIESNYGTLIARHMKLCYDLQRSKYSDYFRENPMHVEISDSDEFSLE